MLYQYGAVERQSLVVSPVIPVIFSGAIGFVGLAQQMGIFDGLARIISKFLRAQNIFDCI